MFPSNPNQNPFQALQTPSIKITQGMLPQGNRLTMPVGTFFNNPSSAANGVLGGVTPQLGIQAPKTPVQGSSFSNFLKDIFKWATTPVESAQRFDENINQAITNTPVGQAVQGITQPQNTPTSAFSQTSPTSAFQPNYLVGANLTNSTPNVMSASVLQTLFPGRNAAEIQVMMASKGYEFRPSNKAGQGGGQWVLNPNFQAEQGKKDSGAGKEPIAANLGQGDFYGYVYNEETGKSEKVIKNKATDSIYNELRWDESTKSYQKVGKLLAQGKIDLYGKTTKKGKAKTKKEIAKEHRQIVQQVYPDRNEYQQQQTPEYVPQTFNQLVTLRVNYG